jgi:hypothetical protein
MTKKTLYRVLGILGIAIIFVVGIWLGRLYSAAGGPGAATLQRFGSTIVRQIRQLWQPSSPPTTDSGVDVPGVSLEQLKEKLDAGAELVLVDVRSQEAFDEGHIPGAISIPWEEMEARYTELPRDREIVTYCARC